MILQLNDYQSAIASDELALIIDGNPFAISDTEALAVGIVTSYLRARFDVAKIITQITQFDATVTYPAGQRVLYNNILYFAKIETAGSQPDTSAKWQKGNNMNAVIRCRLLDIALYQLHKKVSLRQIPNKIAIAFEEAISWLKAVNNGIVDPGLPVREDVPQAGESVLFTSRPRRKTHNII